MFLTKIRFLVLEYAFVLALLLHYHSFFAVDWCLNFSLILNDYDITIKSGLLLKNQTTAFNERLNLLLEKGVNLEYEQGQFFFDIFARIKGYQLFQKEQPEFQKFTLSPPHRGMTISLNCTTHNSDLMVKILPVYCDPNNTYKALLKNLFFYNFLARNFKLSADGNWTFVEYQTENGYRSFKDFANKLNTSGIYKMKVFNIGSNVQNEENALKYLKQAIALIMTDYTNNHLNNYCGNLIEAVRTGFYEGLNQRG